jgi:antitoxin MazE
MGVSVIAKAAELSESERVEIETPGGDIVIRRPTARARADAEAAAEEIIDESRNHLLSGVTTRELLDEGRRG